MECKVSGGEWVDAVMTFGKLKRRAENMEAKRVSDYKQARGPFSSLRHQRLINGQVQR
jgi:hypothetical protein